jgi:hypothetical protein
MKTPSPILTAELPLAIAGWRCADEMPPLPAIKASLTDYEFLVL